MNRATARTGIVVGTAAAITASLAIAGAADAAITVNLGTVMQVAPRPAIVYTGSFGSFVTSGLDAAGTRTVTRFDLGGIAQSLGGNLALVEVRVRDTGTNTYGAWSPGADIDLLRITGANLAGGTVTASYQGTVTQHTGEGNDVLKNRVAGCDAVSGDQHFNSQHFVSLGLNGLTSLSFADFAQGSGGLAGDGPGGWGGGGSGGESGGGEPGNGTTYGGLVILSGMALEIGEAGTGESYGAELVFETVAVPAPGAIALFAGAGLLRRRRR